MAIVRIQRTEGVTIEMYDAVEQKVRVDENPPSGLIVHTAAVVDGALQVVDVWESEEAANRFGEDRLRPAIMSVAGDQMQQQVPPQVTVYELHSLVMP